MAQPPIPQDSKITPDLPPPHSPPIDSHWLPPVKPASQSASYGTVASHQQPLGQPLQLPLNYVPQQQLPLGTLPQQQYPLGAVPQQQGLYPSPQVPLGVYITGQTAPPLTEAQIGQQYQASQLALCASGRHSRTSKFGVFGIIGAIVFFPIGLLCLFADREEYCMRCGERL